MSPSPEKTKHAGGANMQIPKHKRAGKIKMQKPSTQARQKNKTATAKHTFKNNKATR